MTFSSTWSSASTNPQDQDDAPPPVPGKYSVALTDARAFTSKAGKEVLVCELRIMDGAQEGYKWSVLMGFQSEGAAGVAKSFCSGLGVDVESVEPPIENLNDALRPHVGSYYSVEVYENKGYRNTKVIGRDSSTPVSDVPSDDAPAHAPGVDTSDVPF
jgi:hypothetical protein